MTDNPISIYAAGAAGAAVLAAVIFALTRLGTPRNSNPAMTLSVRWGREKLRVPLPAPDAKLGTLRGILAEQTALPPSDFKLIHAGAVMKDDNAPLSAYGLRDGSKIAIIDGAANARTAPPPPPDENTTKKKPETEDATITIIRDELARVHERLVPALDAFLVAIAPPPTPTSTAPDAEPADVPSSSAQVPSIPQTTRPKPPPSSALPDIEMEHRRLGEELLQSLLRLDVLNLDGSWTLARTERKNAIKVVQALLERLDGGWRERTERLASQAQPLAARDREAKHELREYEKHQKRQSASHRERGSAAI